MQLINLDSSNSVFDSTIKAYTSLDYLAKFINDNGSFTSLPLVCKYDDKLNTQLPNYAIQSKITLIDSFTYQKTDGQTEFDIVANSCFNLDNLAKLMSDNNTKLGGTKNLFSIKKSYISDNKAKQYLSNNRIRFKTGEGAGVAITGGFILQENGDYLLQEDNGRLIIE